MSVSGAGGRGRVTEKVVVREPTRFATSVYEERLSGLQTLEALEDGDGARVQLSLEYELTSQNPLRGLTDLLFIRRALRDVMSRCIHGVDVNPMAVELCKLSLRLEGLEPSRPLSFLDDRILCGNSLLGTTPALIEGGIPDDAYKPLLGDEKDVTKAWRQHNTKERKGQTTLRLDGGDPGRDAVLVVPPEVDNPEGTLVSAALVPGRDLATRVTAATLVDGPHQ